jgi:Rod binding domain-containing protein
MREGQVESGLLSPAPGEDMLTSLMDDRLASVAAARMKRGLGAALYRQLSRRLPPAAGAEETP